MCYSCCSPYSCCPPRCGSRCGPCGPCKPCRPCVPCGPSGSYGSCLDCRKPCGESNICRPTCCFYFG